MLNSYDLFNAYCMFSLNGSVDSFKQITRNFLMFLSYAHCTAATAFLVYLQSLDYCFHFFPWHWKYMLCSMIDIRENVVKYYTNMQLLKQKDVHIFFYNSLYFAYFEIKSIADFTDFLTRSFSAAVQRCASHKLTF